jgi:HSP20 family protein
MLQTSRNRLLAPGLASPTRVEALVFEPWNDLTTEMDRLVSAVRPGGAGAAGTAGGGAAGQRAELAWVPPVDVEERDDGVRLAFEVPGVAPDALEVTVDDHVLTVRGERPFARPEDGGGRSAYRLERRYGRFARSLALPRTVDPDRIEASCEHGVLRLLVPKRPEAQPRRIAVTAAADPASAGAAPRLDRGPATA